MPARHRYRASGLVQVPLCEERDYVQAFSRESGERAGLQGLQWTTVQDALYIILGSPLRVFSLKGGRHGRGNQTETKT